MVRRLISAVILAGVSQSGFAAGNVLYFSCTALDKRADDLLVVVDQPSGTVSLQSDKSGEGLNFTSPASFGPAQVTWRNLSKSFPQKFSIDRSSLILKRETTSAVTGSVYVETSPCTIVRAPSGRKF